ncbi:MAG: hypothetical protein KDD44_01450 [Bdellovibrionales bacterium]|nr:hypothetical protein [Bdellovibrionales bacterium]
MGCLEVGQPRVRLRAAIGTVAMLVGAGCSWFSTEQPPVADVPVEESANAGSWYNSSLFRPMFGDFEQVPQFEISNPRELEGLYRRGSYLSRAVAACGACHGATPGDPASPLSGGREVADGFGTVRAANITADPQTGIGQWSISELMRAIRSSIDREGRPLSLDVHRGYRWMSDRDAQALSVYLLATEPVENAVERRRLGPFERNRWGVVPQHEEVEGYVTEAKERASANYGYYLANRVSQCQLCHTRPDGWFTGEVPFAGTAVPTDAEAVESRVDAISSLLRFRSPTLDAETEALISPAGREDVRKRMPEKERSEEASVATDVAVSQDFPTTGPDIRGSSPTGLAGWSQDDIVHYLSTGQSVNGAMTDPERCPWRHYRLMTESDKAAIAAYLKQL